MLSNRPSSGRPRRDPIRSKCDSCELETIISHFEEIVEVPANVPCYPTYHSSIVATGKYGIAPGELHAPSCLAIHEDTHQIFIANRFNNTVEVFSETGEFLNQLGVGQLSEPHGLAIHGDNIYVSCMGDMCDTVNKFCLTEMCHVRSIGSEGSNDEHLNYLNQLTTDPIGRVFIADQSNNRICIHDPDLNRLSNITHQSISLPFDVMRSNPCMLVLTLEGDMLHSLITCGEGMDVLGPFFFCLDLLNNFIISDHDSHSIRVFSPEGNLLHTIGIEGDQQGMFQ